MINISGTAEIKIADLLDDIKEWAIEEILDGTKNDTVYQINLTSDNHKYRLEYKRGNEEGEILAYLHSGVDNPTNNQEYCIYALITLKIEMMARYVEIHTLENNKEMLFQQEARNLKRNLAKVKEETKITQQESVQTQFC